MSINIIKLVVGIDTLDAFARWQQEERLMFEGQEANIVRTRYQPKRGDEILESGGSIYRVIKGRICCRQKIIGFDQTQDSEGKPQCLILTDTDIIQTHAAHHRPFQGWRYLKEAHIPADRGLYHIGQDESDDLPPEMEAELRASGLL